MADVVVSCVALLLLVCVSVHDAKWGRAWSSGCTSRHARTPSPAGWAARSGGSASGKQGLAGHTLFTEPDVTLLPAPPDTPFPRPPTPSPPTPGPHPLPLSPYSCFMTPSSLTTVLKFPKLYDSLSSLLRRCVYKKLKGGVRMCCTGLATWLIFALFYKPEWFSYIVQNNSRLTIIWHSKLDI